MYIGLLLGRTDRSLLLNKRNDHRAVGPVFRRAAAPVSRPSRATRLESNPTPGRLARLREARAAKLRPLRDRKAGHRLGWCGICIPGRDLARSSRSPGKLRNRRSDKAVRHGWFSTPRPGDIGLGRPARDDAQCPRPTLDNADNRPWSEADQTAG